jgi:enoyl-CoA hydratase
VTDAVLIERDGPVVTVTLNRPEVKNAVNPEILCRLADAGDLIDGDDSVRVAIITGAGGSFCAGADLDKLVTASLKGLPPENEFEQRCREDPGTIFKGFLRTYRLQKPLIGAIEGHCIAGGTELLMSIDIRIAGESATFGISEVRWGLFPMAGSTVRMRRQIPYTWAMEMLLTGDHYPASDAERMGLIGHVVPDGQAIVKAREIALRVAENGPLAVRKIKQAVLETEFLPEEKAFEIDLKLGMEAMSSQDAREGPKAFKEKLKPQFQGR